MSRKFATHKITMDLVGRKQGANRPYFIKATITAYCGRTTKSNEFSLGQDGIHNLEIYSWVIAMNRRVFDSFGLKLDHYRPLHDWLNYVEKTHAVYGWYNVVKFTDAFVNNIFRGMSEPDRLWIDIITVRVIDRL